MLFMFYVFSNEKDQRVYELVYEGKEKYVIESYDDDAMLIVFEIEVFNDNMDED